MIPSGEECLSLLEKYRVPPHIRRHSLQVARIAMFLGRRIAKKQRVNLKLLEAASLLHDLDKHHCYGDVCSHGKISERILRKEGHAELAPLIRAHIMTSVLKRELRTIEEKILYYSDLRVRHDRIVSLEERMVYIKKRYGPKGPGVMKDLLRTEPIAFRVEKEVLKKAGVSERLEGLPEFNI